MHCHRHYRFLPALIWLAIILFCGNSHAQTLAQTLAWLSAPAVVPARISAAPDNAHLAILKGNLHPLARPEYDEGIVRDSLPMEHMVLLLQRSPEQEKLLAAVMDGLHHRQSPLFHHWLTPKQFGQHFGPSDPDLAVLTSWLQAQGFRVDEVTPGRTSIIFSGTAGQLRLAFHTEIHNLNVGGARHIANMTAPEGIPLALAPIVRGFLSLHDFFPKPAKQDAGLVSLDRKKGRWQPASIAGGKAVADLTFQNPAGTFFYFVGPQDFYTIYNETGVSSFLSGSGVTLALIEQSDVCNGQAGPPCNGNDDNGAFLSQFGVTSTGSLNYMFGVSGYCSDPGFPATSEEGAADVDVQWAGAVAPGANIDFVSCASTSTTSGIALAAEYAVNSLASEVAAISVSYSQCEAEAGPATTAAYSDLWQQAAAQGQTVVVAAGGGGSMNCDQGQEFATNNLSVNALGSSVYNVAAGGTDFSDTYQGTNTTYWSQNVPPTSPYETAISYVPEMAWGGVCSSPVLASYLKNMGITTWGTSYNPESICNYSYTHSGGDIVTVSGGGGGVSAFNSLPTWQGVYGVGLTGNNSSTVFRNTPDISFFASNNATFWNHSLLYCQSDTGATCDFSNSDNDLALAAGGTSFVAPQIAGVMALVVQQQSGAFQGNANYTLYNLATQEYGSPATPNTTNLSACTGSGLGSGLSSCIFQDIAGDTPNPAGGAIASDIVQPCLWSGSYTNCFLADTGDAIGLSSASHSTFSDAYPVSQGYDLATGLGSVNIANLVFGWSSVFPPLATTVTVAANPAILFTTSTSGSTLTATVVASGRGGTVAPAGSVTFSPSVFSSVCSLTSFSAFLTPSCGGTPPNYTCVGVATLAVPGNCFNVGTTVIPAQYSGDASNDAPSASVSGASVTLIQPQLQVIPSVPAITIVGGQSGTVQFSISSSGPATGVSFVCLGLPLAAGCTFSPSLIASLSSSSPMTVTMTVTTTASIAGSRNDRPEDGRRRGLLLAGAKLSAGCFSLAVFLLPAGVMTGKNIRRTAILLLLGMIFALVISLAGCGSSNGNGNLSPQANYTVFIKALASNTTADVASVQVIVTQ